MLASKQGFATLGANVMWLAAACAEACIAHKSVRTLHATRHLLFPAEHNPGKDLLEALAGAAEAKVSAFTSQNISNLVR